MKEKTDTLLCPLLILLFIIIMSMNSAAAGRPDHSTVYCIDTPSSNTIYTDLGDLPAGVVRPVEIAIKNNLASAVRLQKGAASCSCIATSGTLVLLPGEVGALDVLFRTGSRLGKVKQYISYKIGGTNLPPIVVDCSCDVSRRLIEPPLLNLNGEPRQTVEGKFSIYEGAGYRMVSVAEVGQPSLSPAKLVVEKNEVSVLILCPTNSGRIEREFVFKFKDQNGKDINTSAQAIINVSNPVFQEPELYLGIASKDNLIAKREFSLTEDASNYDCELRRSDLLRDFHIQVDESGKRLNMKVELKAGTKPGVYVLSLDIRSKKNPNNILVSVPVRVLVL